MRHPKPMFFKLLTQLMRDELAFGRDNGGGTTINAKTTTHAITTIISIQVNAAWRFVFGACMA